MKRPNPGHLVAAIAFALHTRGDDIVLEASYSDETAIPEAYRALYTKRGNSWELTRVRGIKTAADFERMENGIKMERNDHKEAKQKLAEWEKLGESPEAVHAQLDTIPELQAKAEAAGGDEEAIERRIQARVDAAVNPLKRQLEKVESERDNATGRVETLETEARDGRVSSRLRAAATEAKMEPTAVDDQVSLYLRTFHETEDGQIVTRDGVGVTPGLDPKAFFEDMRENGKKPYLWGANSGGGATGGDNSPGSAGNNPWSAKNWNVTKQGQIMAADPSKAKRMAETAGHSNAGTARRSDATDFDPKAHGTTRRHGGLL